MCKLVKVSFGDTKKTEGEYPNDLVEMLPAIARLKPKARKSIKNILENPRKTKELLGLIDVVSDKKTKERFHEIHPELYPQGYLIALCSRDSARRGRYSGCLAKQQPTGCIGFIREPRKRLYDLE